MFSIIISEKGSPDRKENFNRSEVTIGRGAGNDLILPRGNVSKHHARLVVRDGRFIISDLGSTNGIYVNGRRIGQATVVRVGDKIYLADFVIRIATFDGVVVPVAPTDTGSAAPLASSLGSVPTVVGPQTTGFGEPSVPSGPIIVVGPSVTGQIAPSQIASGGPMTEIQPFPPKPAKEGSSNPPPAHNHHAATLNAPTHPPGVPPPRPLQQNVSIAPVGPRPPASPSSAREQDLDESMGLPRPLPPRSAVPSVTNPAAAQPGVAPMNPMPPRAVGTKPPTIPPISAIPDSRAPEQAPPTKPASSAAAHVPPAAFVAQQPVVSPPRAATKESPAQAAQHLAVTMLLGRIADSVDLSALRATPIVPDALAAQIERAAQDQAKAMRTEGEIPDDVDLELLVRTAHRELVGLGVLGPLLDDEEVTEIHCARFDRILVARGRTVAAEGLGFSSDEALQRVIWRLVNQSGEPLRTGEIIIERHLARATVVALAPPAASNHVLTVRKRRRIETGLEQLVLMNSLSQPMAQLLEACVAGHVNVLVAGSPSSSLVLSALAAAGAPNERMVVVQDADEVAVGGAHIVHLSSGALRAAPALRPDRLVVTRLAGEIATATLDSMTSGTTSVFAAIQAMTLRQGLSRLVAQVVLHRPGLAVDAVRDIVGEAFDIVLEVATTADGRARITRISELSSEAQKGLVARDLFVFTPDATGGDGTFAASGVVPRIAADLAARGIRLDSSLFKRTVR
ncbi:MAG: Flp pilus assembly complex ATPase component TadA [Polyangiaceae bacterium]|nr:Flp pilus assembly complex ATPase component TadA [Polyangiaceae bacterium]